MSEDPDKEVWEYLDGPGKVEETYGLGYFRKPVHKKRWETKDSGVRAEYASGMVRDTQESKPRFDLIYVEGMPYDYQMLTRLAALLERGAVKYGYRNWELANSKEEVDRFKASGLRHHYQYLMGETDEDHAAAAVFNIFAAESIQWKIDNS